MYNNADSIITNIKDLPQKLSNPFSEFMFASLLSKQDRECSGTEVFIKILADKNESYVQISVLTKEMLECDNSFFEKSGENQEWKYPFQRVDYHPYFCEFFADCKKFKGKITRSQIGKWIKAKLLLCKEFNENDSNDKNVIEGFLLFSASPTIRIQAYLQLTEQIINSDEIFKLKNINNFIEQYNKDTSKLIEDDIVKKTKDISNISGKIYNVGQGNCISITINEKYNIYFDIGESINPSNFTNENNFIHENYLYIQKERPEFIILSHWHMDHFLGIARCELWKSKGGIPFWIAPNLNIIAKSSQSRAAMLLCAFLIKQERILLFDNNRRGNNNYIPALESSMNNSRFSLWQGGGNKSPNGIVNNVGLILKISLNLNNNDNFNRNGPQNLLFTGDCEYMQMPEGIFKEYGQTVGYDLVVTPHHGSKYAVCNYKANNRTYKGSLYSFSRCVESNIKGRAIISVGVNNYKHPSVEHIAMLREHGFSVYNTIRCLRIDFSIKNDSRLHIKTVNNKI